jgi:hypothetical protein
MLLAPTQGWDLTKDSHKHDDDNVEVYKRQDAVNVTNFAEYSIYVIPTILIIITSYFPSESSLGCLSRSNDSLQAWRFGVLNPVGLSEFLQTSRPVPNPTQPSVQRVQGLFQEVKRSDWGVVLTTRPL